ncbi:DUF4350 domain-containing protein [Lutibacter sp. TH_r2]|uniref:DUF4350 domain-containing protein n=1 Tax=Lutibacter sp. TH_r2 TaxID=3082083 RepID=UPI00295319A4|nr:DUF4350 domain-containing protein [Lutibacter sp. TH_r2]MDV7188139.1 DUF4350 domain-containing protein [Lutibacter sp. TH_r2]
MSRKTYIYIGFLVLLIGAMLYLESTKKKPINWYPTYAAKHKIPYGTYVLKEQLANLFPNTKVKTIYKTPYVYLKEEEQNGTYVFINNAINFGDEEFSQLMKFVARGNNVFISTRAINIDTLNFECERLVSNNFDEKVIFKFKNKAFKNKEYTFDKAISNYVFKQIDTVNTTILGITAYVNNADERTEEGVNFVKFNYGKGEFFFHTFPEVFTNYNILNGENHQHAANILSYLDEEKPILWDAYYKTGKSRIASPMYYLLNNKHLKWAYYLALFGVLFFVIFEGKRKQRSIAILKPLKNQTLAFTRTISNMYFEKSEHKSIAEHKISYLLEFIRTKLHIPTSEINQTFYKNLAARSGHDIEKIKTLFEYCEQIHMRNEITETQLMTLNTMIENFKNTIHYGK